MRFYLDTEFIERGYERIELISIGVVAEDGREFYAVLSDGWDESHASDWVRAHVLPNLAAPKEQWLPRAEVARQLIKFVGNMPEFWGYFADYDWVLVCQLFGRMIDLPNGWPMFCRDLEQMWSSLHPRPAKPPSDELHNALGDARWMRSFHAALLGFAPPLPAGAVALGEALKLFNRGKDEERRARDELNKLRERAEKAEVALQKINGIRNSIVGAQTLNWSEHIYPLVAALNEAGLVGEKYVDARASVGTLIERTKQAEAERDELSALVHELARELQDAVSKLRREMEAPSRPARDVGRKGGE
jgi:hypothetical protein